MRFAAVAAGLLLWASCQGPQPEPTAAIEQAASDGSVELKLHVDRDRIGVDENVTVRVEAAYPETLEVDFPDRLGAESELRSSTVDTSLPRLGEDGRIRVQQSYLVEPYVAGPLMIPEIEVRYRDKGGQEGEKVVKTEAFEIAVEGVPSAEEENAELRDIHDPLDMPFPAWWGVAGVLAALAALAAWLWLQSRKRPPRAPEEPPEPADAIALRELDALLAEGLAERGLIKELYGGVSDILRRYIEARFGLHAPEQTTEEFLDELRRTLGFDPAHRALLREFLEHTDLVKFAEARPTERQIEATVAACRSFIVETKPKPQGEGVPGGPVVPRA